MEYAIYPGKPWLDTEGNRIQAHGAGMYYENGIFYWYGENKEFTTGDGKVWTWGIRCYSSADLINWKNEGFLIEAQPDDKKSPFHPKRRMDRPHIVKNPNTGKYIMWLKYCDKSDFTICSADHFLGPWKMEKTSYRAYGRKCGDFDLAVGEDGTGYLYVELDHEKTISCKLTSDYLDTDGDFVAHYEGLHPPFAREGVAHMQRNGKHYLFTSGMLGYVPNPSQWAVGDSWMGPYQDMGDPHVEDDSKGSFNSQISYIFKHPTKKDLYIAMADRWVPDYPMTADKYDRMVRAIASNYDKSIKVTFMEKMQLVRELLRSPVMSTANTSVANYVWLPIEFHDDIPSIRWQDSWTPENYE